MPWTISFIVRKRQQIDNLAEVPKEKRPPELMLWWGKPEDIENWFDRVYERRNVQTPETITFNVSEKDIE